MNPIDFIELADELKTSEKEAKRRTAISRCYYGAYNYLKQFFVESGIDISESADGHKQLVDYLSHSNVTKTQIIGEQIKNLRKERNSADYNMSIQSFDKNKTQLLVVKAKNAIDNFNKINKDEQKIILSNVKQHIELKTSN
ncbi:MAG: HEPN domain-containing protein [Candidatus Schekmanbacteria bacterium]|nr:HEPN domain-containing protein [Candidatus Schekmanbacteria bacterium]